MSKKIYIELLGCAKNQVDAEVMLSHLTRDNWQRVLDPKESDVIIVNTCGFIQSAKEEAINTFFELYEQYGDKKFILSGCLAQRYGKDMDLIEANGIFGNRDLSQICNLANAVLNGEKKILIPEYSKTDTESYDRPILYNYKNSAFLKISEGCNRRCRYCAIPVIRGGLRSVPFDTIINEAKRLIKNGVYEINIIAQDLAAYGLDLYNKSMFLPLMETLAKLEGNFVLRMLYIHPDFFPLELLDLVKKYDKILPYFDIPFQHVDKDVVKAMGRKGDSDSYLNLIKTIKKELPLAFIRSTIMLGFTFESEESIKKLYNFLKEAKIDWVGFFLYSKEEDTPSFNDCSEKQLKKNLKLGEKAMKDLMSLQQEITQEALKRLIGTKTNMIIEDPIENSDLYIGRIYAQAPEVDGLCVLSSCEKLESGDIVKVKINGVRGIDLKAELL